MNGHSGEDMRVLLIEDTEEDIELFKHRVESDIQLVVAMTLADGVLQVHEYHPDIVVLDLNLPDSMGGVKTYESFSLQTQGEKPFPVIIYTQYDDAELAKECIDMGAAAFIGKSQLADSRLPEVLKLAAEVNRLRSEPQDSGIAEIVNGITNTFRKVIADIKGRSR